MRRLLIIPTLAILLSGCAQWRQSTEVYANVVIDDQRKLDDDLARAAIIAPSGVTAGALARLPDGPTKCAMATLAGLALTSCNTQITLEQIQAIVASQFANAFGPKPSTH